MHRSRGASSSVAVAGGAVPRRSWVGGRRRSSRWARLVRARGGERRRGRRAVAGFGRPAGAELAGNGGWVGRPGALACWRVWRGVVATSPSIWGSSRYRAGPRARSAQRGRGLTPYMGVQVVPGVPMSATVARRRAASRRAGPGSARRSCLGRPTGAPATPRHQRMINGSRLSSAAAMRLVRLLPALLAAAALSACGGDDPVLEEAATPAPEATASDSRPTPSRPRTTTAAAARPRSSARSASTPVTGR